MVVALVSVVAVAAVVAAVLQSRTAAARRQEAEAARAEAARTAEARDALERTAAELTAESTRLADELQRSRERIDELSLLLEAATAAPATDDGDGLWRLLLAHVARRWAAVVGVPPDGRGVHAQDPDDQLVEALGRETERLREEVGVDVEMSAVAPEATHPTVPTDAGDRVAVLVAALELLGALAGTAQSVAVEVGDAIVLTGEGWVDPYGDVSAAHQRSERAGVALGPLEAEDDRVRVVLHHRPVVTATSHPR
ncbi:MAG TPA: hypothetical protein VFW63_06765 [Acidimicrobiales bacterium]|nr:hypothetical protein [Acidimicrobiales bacterium]